MEALRPALATEATNLVDAADITDVTATIIAEDIGTSSVTDPGRPDARDRIE